MPGRVREFSIQLSKTESAHVMEVRDQYKSYELKKEIRI
jgi:hypothetical protein